MGLAFWLAGRLCVQGEELDEVRGDALLGLAQALASFEPGRGASFASWARTKIVFAIQDGKRGRDHLSRGHRRLLRGREGSAAELPPLSLDAPLSRDVVEDGEVLRIESLADEHDELSGVIVRDLYGRLSERERLVLTMADAGFRLSEIGALVGLTESRVCQIRRRALARLA